jgi:hypothetical protein
MANFEVGEVAGFVVSFMHSLSFGSFSFPDVGSVSRWSPNETSISDPDMADGSSLTDIRPS